MKAIPKPYDTIWFHYVKFFFRFFLGTKNFTKSSLSFTFNPSMHMAVDIVYIVSYK